MQGSKQCLCKDNFIERDFNKHCTEISKPLEEKQYSDEDVKMMMTALAEDYQKRPDYIPNYAIELAIYTGMRVGELAGLKWEDISDTSIFINRSEKYNPVLKEYYTGDTKNGWPRHFPVNETLIDLFQRLRNIYKENGGLSEWFFSKDGE